MILHRQDSSRGTPLGSPELVMLAPRLGITGGGRNAPTEPETPLAQAGVTRCAWCRWKHAGTLEDGHEKLVDHRALKHPDRVVPKRRRRTKRTWQQVANRTLDDNIAGVRAQGGAAWDSET